MTTIDKFIESYADHVTCRDCFLYGACEDEDDRDCEDAIRAALAVPDAAAAAREKLEQARVDGVIDAVQINTPSQYRETYAVGVDEKSLGHKYFYATTEAAALAQSADHCDDLRQQRDAKVQALPDVEGMNWPQRFSEMERLGWSFFEQVSQKKHVWVKDGHAIESTPGEMNGELTKRALIEARKQSGAQ